MGQCILHLRIRLLPQVTVLCALHTRYRSKNLTPQHLFQTSRFRLHCLCHEGPHCQGWFIYPSPLLTALSNVPIYITFIYYFTWPDFLISLHSLSFHRYMLLFPLKTSGRNSLKRVSCPGLECSTTGKTVTTKSESVITSLSSSQSYWVLTIVLSQHYKLCYCISVLKVIKLFVRKVLDGGKDLIMHLPLLAFLSVEKMSSIWHVWFWFIAIVPWRDVSY